MKINNSPYVPIIASTAVALTLALPGCKNGHTDHDLGHTFYDSWSYREKDFLVEKSIVLNWLGRMHAWSIPDGFSPKHEALKKVASDYCAYQMRDVEGFLQIGAGTGVSRAAWTQVRWDYMQKRYGMPVLGKATECGYAILAADRKKENVAVQFIISIEGGATPNPMYIIRLAAFTHSEVFAFHESKYGGTVRVRHDSWRPHGKSYLGLMLEAYCGGSSRGSGRGEQENAPDADNAGDAGDRNAGDAGDDGIAGNTRNRATEGNMNNAGHSFLQRNMDKGLQVPPPRFRRMKNPPVRGRELNMRIPRRA